MRTAKYKTEQEVSSVLPAGVYAGIIEDIRYARRGKEIMHNANGEYAIEVFITEIKTQRTVSKIIWITDRGKWVIENLYKALGKRYDASSTVDVEEIKNIRLFFIMANVIDVYENKEVIRGTEVSPYFFPFAIANNQQLVPEVETSKLEIRRNKLPEKEQKSLFE